MPNSVEDRVVAMKMENQQFEKAVNQSLQSWGKLETALNKGIQAKGFDNIQSSVGRFNLNPITNSLSEVSKAWLAMSTIAVTALATITSQVVQTGLQTAKSLTVEPILQGFNEYSTNLNSIQTVLANTQAQGSTLDDVNHALQQLNHYSDKTIYNFGEMARNIGTFTAAGVSLDKSVASIKGIANLAALSGSSSEQASTAMYQLSQAIAAGRVSLQDWNSVVNAGMGGATFQRALVQTAQTMGTIKGNVEGLNDPMAKLSVNGKSFRDSISGIGGEQWLTSDVLTQTLSQFTGDLTDAQLAAQGFNAEQIKSIQQTAKTAQEAATKVKTIAQVFDVLKESIGSGWSLTFQRIFGDFEQARTTFTELSNFLNNIVNKNANARNKILKQWGDLGGRTKIISAVTNAWKALMSVLGPIHDAFREIFPAKTAEQLFQLSKSLNQFFRHLRLTKDAQENLKRTFAGFFAVIHIGISIISGLLHVVGTLLGLFLRGQGTTLAFTGGIGDMLVALDKFLTGGDRMKKFFDGIAQALVFILKPILEVRSALIGAFAGLLTGDTTKFFNGVSDAVENLLGLVDALSDKFATVVNTISDAMGGLGHISGFNLAGMFGGIGGPGGAGGAASAIDKIKNGLTGIEGPSFHIGQIWDKIMAAFRKIGDSMSPIKAAFVQIKDAFQDVFDNLGSGLNFDNFLSVVQTSLFFALYLEFRRFSKALGGVAEAASGVLDQVTNNLKTMQADVRSDVILKIAASLLLLAGAIYILAQTDPANLAAALGAVTLMLGELVTALLVLEKKVAKFGSGAKLVLVGTAFTAMAFGLAALAGAVYLFSKIDPDKLGQGLVGVSLSLALLTGAAAALSKSGAGANMIGAATGLLIMSAALVAMLEAIKVFAAIDGDTLISGLVRVAGAIVILGLAMNAVKGSVGGAVAMAIIAEFGLIPLAKALKAFGDLNTSTIVKGMIAMGAAIAILAGGMQIASSGLVGAVALLIIVKALSQMADVLQTFGNMDLGTIVKGLLAIVGVIIVLSATAALLSEVVPVLLAFGLALLSIGAAVFLAGAGVAAFATGLALLAVNGQAGFGVLMKIIKDFLAELPELVLAFGATITAIAELIGEHVPELQAAFVDLMGGMLDGAVKLTPKIGKLISTLIHTFLRVLVGYYSDLANAGLDLIQNFLDAIDRHVVDIADTATSIATHFVEAMARNAVLFANAALQALIDFLNGLAEAIQSHQAELNAAGANIAQAIIAAIVSPLAGAGGAILDAIQGSVTSAFSNLKIPHVDFTPWNRSLQRADPFSEMAKKLGLIGGVDSVRQAFEKMNQAIDQELSKTSDLLEKHKKQLKELNKQGKGGSKEAQKLRDEISDETKRRKELLEEQKKWDKKMADERSQLIGLAKQYDDLQKQISAAEDALDDITQKRDEIASKFNSTPDITAGMSLQSYLRQLQKKTEQTQKFMETLQQLRALGLSDQAYRQLLNEGTDAQKLMEQLLAGGGAAVVNFNNMNASMQAGAISLADQAAQELYHTGVQAAQGLLDGLKAKMPDLEAQMNAIARLMVKAIKEALKMKSPSRVMMEVGAFSTEGVAIGIESGISSVKKSSEMVANAALETMQAVMNKGVNTDILDINPVIAPVLDLTQLQKDATKIGTMLASEPLVASVSYERASSISNDQTAAAAAALSVETPAPTVVDYTQILQSPKAISPIDTYRATKSAIPLMKEALDV